MIGKERERRLIECRKTAEERKNYFESMERHMFARGSAVKETGRESISTSQEQVNFNFLKMRRHLRNS